MACLCASCNMELPSGVGSFCPFCGHVILNNSIIYDSTTANYDPLNREYKPWRDKPLVPVRKYVVRNSSTKPWLCTIKPPSKAERKIIVEEKTEVPTPSTVLSADTESIGSKSTSINHETIGNDDASSIASSKSRHIIMGTSKNVREFIYPLSIFDLDISGLEDYSIVLLFSLVEQSFVLEREKCRLHWLKISASIKPKSPSFTAQAKEMETSDLDMNEDEDEETWTELCYLSSIVGKFIAWDYKTDWIDLPAIDADEYYMAKHVQQILQPMCYRFQQQIVGLQPSMHYDVYLMKQDAKSRYHGVLSNFTPNEAHEISIAKAKITLLNKKKTCNSVEDPHDDENEEKVCMADVKAYSSLSPSSSSKHQDSNTNSAISTASILDRFSFDDAIFALVEEMRIKQPNAVAFCKVQVKARVIYEQRYQHNHKKGTTEEFTYDFYRNTAEPTHLELWLSPLQAYTTFIFPIVTVRFENNALKHLLKLDKTIQEVFNEAVELEGKATKDHIHEYIRKILSLLRLAYTEEGVYYEIIGAFPEQPLRYWPWPHEMAKELEITEEDDDESEEDD